MQGENEQGKCHQKQEPYQPSFCPLTLLLCYLGHICIIKLLGHICIIKLPGAHVFIRVAKKNFFLQKLFEV